MTNSVRRYVDGKLVGGAGVTDHWDTVEHGRPIKPPSAIIKEEPKMSLPVPKQNEKSEEITDTSGLRKFLLRQMVAASKGEIDTEVTKNIVALTQQIYQATKLELEAAKILADGVNTIRSIELTDREDD